MSSYMTLGWGIIKFKYHQLTKIIGYWVENGGYNFDHLETESNYITCCLARLTVLFKLFRSASCLLPLIYSCRKQFNMRRCGFSIMSSWTSKRGHEAVFFSFFFHSGRHEIFTFWVRLTKWHKEAIQPKQIKDFIADLNSDFNAKKLQLYCFEANKEQHCIYPAMSIMLLSCDKSQFSDWNAYQSLFFLCLPGWIKWGFTELFLDQSICPR